MIQKWIAGRKIGFRLQTVTAVTLIAFAMMLGSVQFMETHRLYDARVNLLQPIVQSGSESPWLIMTRNSPAV